VSRTLRLALLAAALAGCGGGREAAPAADARTAVPLDAAQRQAVVVEMRTLLGSVDGVVRGLNAGDTAAIKAAALRAGSVDAADAALERILPADWMRLAIATHTGFDSLAAAATARGAMRETVLARLAAITPQCVSCHALYRLP
jgi:cytochrome c556